jgi:phospholipid/cholesterol/gamma-HCH transport system ATP-binding protein
VKEGEVLCILGESGSGKSVLLKQIIGLLKPDKGSIKVFGKEITTLPERELNKVRLRMGMLFQECALFDSMNVFDNVAFFLREHTKLSKKEIKKKVMEKLSLVGLAEKAESNISSLSGGMKKRVALARAVVMEPEILLYDEPTTGVDPTMGREICRLIRGLQKRFHLTSLVVTHDIPTVLHVADRIAILYRGRIEHIDTPKTLLHSKESIPSRFFEPFLSVHE